MSKTTRKRIYKIDLDLFEKTTNLNDLFPKFIEFKKAQKMSDRSGLCYRNLEFIELYWRWLCRWAY